MSLAMSAAPFDDNTYIQNSDLSKRRSSGHNKTQKRIPSKAGVDVDKISSVLQSLHNNPDDDEDENEGDMGDFNPPAPPISAGVEKTNNSPENPALDYLKKEDDKRLGRDTRHAEEYRDTSLEMNNYEGNYGSIASNEEYYQKFVPNYTAGSATQPARQSDLENHNRPYYSSYPTTSSTQGVDTNTLLEKLNYMIHLLEEQQDERSGSVTEEVILYSFLGIFIIFLVDSFTKVGKYKR